MANWCEGVIKIRGNKQQIINYLKDLLEPVNFLGDELNIEIIENDYDLILVALDEYKDADNLDVITKRKNIKPEFNHWRLKNTRRAFVECDKKISFDFWGEVQEIITVEGFSQAWGIIPENFTELSKKHNVDLHIFGFEKGMEFTQEVEIHSGKIVKNIESTYAHYEWDVAFSNLGG